MENELAQCPVSTSPYGFVKCRVTLQNPKRDMCVPCAEEEARLVKIKQLSPTHPSESIVKEG